MIYYSQVRRTSFTYRLLSAFVAFSFLFSSIITPSYAQSLISLPVPGTMVMTSPAFVPVLLKGMTIHPNDPFRFDFIVDSGNTGFAQTEIKKESEKLVKYFLASMTIPKNDLWVNLSPYENDRIIPEELGKTELGRDMLAQDYLLKQLTASLMYPKEELGKKFWDKIYAQAQEKFGTTEIPMNTFNKVWIIPESATVYENDKTVYVVNSRLRVLLDEDYLALDKNNENKNSGIDNLSDVQYKDSASLSSQIVHEIILPEIEKEVNQGENFAPLRQIYHSLILAKWYKETIKESLLSKVYVDQNKIAGIELDDQTIKDQIYGRYMEAYKKGVFDFIKEDYDQLSQEVLQRKYFSGGEKFKEIPLKKAKESSNFDAAMVGDNFKLSMRINPHTKGNDSSMIAGTWHKELILYSGPSATGKSPLWERIKKEYPDSFERIVLYTSRDMRSGEEEGVDYKFRSKEEIQELAESDNFVIMQVHNDLQAINLDDVEKAVESGKQAIAEVSVDWAKLLREKYSDKVFSIFVSPLSDIEIKKRVRENNLSVDDVIFQEMLKRQKERSIEKPIAHRKQKTRAKNAIEEMKRKDEYDVVLVNETLRDIQTHQNLWDGEQGLSLVDQFIGLVSSIQTRSKSIRSLPIFSLVQLLNLKENEDRLFFDSKKRDRNGSIDLFLPGENAISEVLLENMYKEVSEKHGKLEEVVGKQSEAASFSLYLRRSTDSISDGSLIRLELSDKFYIEAIPTERTDVVKDARYEHREDIKFISALNALTYVPEEVRGNIIREGEEGYEIYSARKEVFAKYLGAENAKFFDIFRAVRIEIAKAKGGNDTIMAIAFGPNRNMFEDFKRSFDMQLKKQFPNEDPDAAIEKLQKAVKRYIDLNDLLIELINKNVADGLWGYDEAAKILFLQQIKVGIVSEGIVDGINKDNNSIEVVRADGTKYRFNLQYNPERANRGSFAKKDMGVGETNISRRFIEQWFPLQRYIPLGGEEESGYRVLANPFPHLRNSINIVGNNPRASQTASVQNILDAYTFLENASPQEGEDRFRVFMNPRFGGASFDNIHFQGFFKKTAFEDAIEGIKDGAFKLVAELDGTTISEIREGVYWMPTILEVKGTNKQDVVNSIITILRKANKDGFLELTRDSKFSYNILFKYDGTNYQAYIVVKEFLDSYEIVSEKQFNKLKEHLEKNNEVLDVKDIFEKLIENNWADWVYEENKTAVRLKVKLDDVKDNMSTKFSRNFEEIFKVFQQSQSADPDKKIMVVNIDVPSGEVNSATGEEKIFFDGRPATIEMFDAFIYDNKGVKDMFDTVSADVRKQKRIFSVLGEKLKYNDFDNLVNDIKSTAKKSSTDSAMLSNKIIVHFNEEEALNNVFVGGKAMSLARLSRIVNVPKAFFVSTIAFNRFVSDELKSLIDELDGLSAKWVIARIHGNLDEQKSSADLIHALNENIRQKMMKINIQTQIAEEIRSSYKNLSESENVENLPVAVRSSATYEDQEGVSAAGQHNTYSNVIGEKNVVAAVRKSWISLFNDRAVDYRNNQNVLRIQKAIQGKDVSEGWISGEIGKGLLHSAVTMGVVVQRSVAPKVAGIGFSIDPVTGKDAIRLSVNYGFGELSVSGEVTSEAWWIDPENLEIIGWNIGDKKTKAVIKESGGLEHIDTSAEERNSFALEDQKASKIARQIQRISDDYSGGDKSSRIDTEFLVDETGELYFVQARPVTGSWGRKMMIEPSEKESNTPIVKVGGRIANIGAATGKIHIVNNPKEVQDGDIVVTLATNPDWALSMSRASAIITGIGDELSHAAIVSRELNIPSIVGAENIIARLKDLGLDGEIVTIDTFMREVYKGTLGLVERDNFKDEEIADQIIDIEQTVDEGIKEIRDRRRSTVIDNIEWHARPPHILPVFQRDLMVKGYQWVGKSFGVPFEVKEEEEIVYVKLEDNFNPRYELAALSLDELQMKMSHRDNNVEELLKLMEDFKFTPIKLKQFEKLYIEFIAAMSISREFRTILQIRLSEVFRDLKIPTAAQEILLRAAEQQTSFTSGEGIKEYEALLKKVRNVRDNSGRMIFLNYESEELLDELSTNHPSLFKQMLRYLNRYKSAGMKADIRLGPPINDFINRMKSDIREKAPQYDIPATDFDEGIQQVQNVFNLSFSESQISKLRQVSIMATSAARQMENEHHYKTRIHYGIREKLLWFAEKMMRKNIFTNTLALEKPDEIFDHTIDEIITSFQAVLKLAPDIKQKLGSIDTALESIEDLNLDEEEIILATEMLFLNEELDRIDKEVHGVFMERKNVAIDENSLELRKSRLVAAWQVALKIRDLREEVSTNSILKHWINKIAAKSLRVHHESFLYLASNPGVTVVPFSQLNRFGKGLDQILNHQIALHQGKYLPDGISLSEAQSPPNFTQPLHEHKKAERSIMLSSKTNIETTQKEGDVLTQEVPFGYMVRVPENLTHRLANPEDNSSPDITLKDPLLSLYKGFKLIERDTVDSVRIIKPKIEDMSNRQGQILTHYYPAMYSDLEFSERGQLQYDEDGDPKVKGKTYVRVRLVTLNPNEESDDLQVDSIYPNFQVVRVFPWAKDITGAWDIEKDTEKIQGETSFLDAKNESQKKTFKGGDLLVINSAENESGIENLRIRNTSNEHVLMFAIVDKMPADDRNQDSFLNGLSLSERFENIYNLSVNDFLDAQKEEGIRKLRTNIAKGANIRVIDNTGQPIKNRPGISLVAYLGKEISQFKQKEGDLDELLEGIGGTLSEVARVSDKEDLHMTIGAFLHPDKKESAPASEIVQNERDELKKSFVEKLADEKIRSLGTIKVKFKGVSVSPNGRINILGYPEVDYSAEQDKVNILRSLLGLKYDSSPEVPTFHISLATLFKIDDINYDRLKEIVKKYQGTEFGTLSVDLLTLLYHENDLLSDGKVLVARNIDGENHDEAMMSSERVGGIDMNEIKVDRQGSGVDIQFDPAMMQDILINGVDGFVPVILNITPINSVMPLLGLKKTEPQEPSERITRIDPYLSYDPRNREEEYAISSLN